MNEQVEDFWPSDLEVATKTTPVTILTEQAAHLGQRTKNLVEARVYTTPQNQGFRHTLYLLVPTMSTYRFELLSVFHPPSIYPIAIADMTDNDRAEVTTLAQFKKVLRKILSSDRVKQIINNLITYATNQHGTPP